MGHKVRSGRFAAAARIDELIERLDLAGIADRKAKGFSQGERTKVALARALARVQRLDGVTALGGIVRVEIAGRPLHVDDFHAHHEIAAGLEALEIF